MSDRLDFEQHDALADALRIESVEVARSVAKIGLRRSALLASIVVPEVTIGAGPVRSGIGAATKFAVAACIAAALGIGFVAGRMTADAPRAPIVDAPGAPVVDALVVIDAAPADAMPAKVRPAPALLPNVPRSPTDLYSALDEPLLIEEARAALRRNLGADAQRALAAHQTRFPAGQMVEERLVLSIEVAIQLDYPVEKIRALIANYKSKFSQGSLSDRVNQLEATLASP
jgi:hypothetical protein